MAVVAVVGAGAVGRTLADRLADAGEDVVVGVRDPEGESASRARTALPGVAVTGVAGAIARDAAVVVATPGAAVPAFAAEHGSALAGRAFCSVGWVVLADPVVAGSAPPCPGAVRRRPTSSTASRDSGSSSR